MDEDREEEWLAHIAAGTDPLTGFAALPDKRPRKSTGYLGAVLLILCVLWVLALL